MNAAIRAVTRCGIAHGWDVIGVRHGYRGLIDGEYTPLGMRTVSGVLQMGGTLLGSARCPEFHHDDGPRTALAKMKDAGIDGLVVIGGNGSQTGAAALSKTGFPVVGVASTIDNDLVGSDVTIGVDTALNIALEAIDRLKTTASSHHRAFLVEVMGRNCGYLALMAGLAGGAEVVITPERDLSAEEVASVLGSAHSNGKAHAIAVVAEGSRLKAEALAEALERQHGGRMGFQLRTTILGHVQRGGVPTAADRLLGTRLGAGAVDALADGAHGMLIGVIHGAISRTPFAEVIGRQKGIDPALLELTGVLDR
jgi:6-phosphofructokinase 1